MSSQGILTASARRRFIFSNLFVFLAAFVAGLALTRILFEWLFPQFVWLGRPYFVLPFSIILAILIIFTIHHTSTCYLRSPLSTSSQFTIHHSQFILAPLLFNILWLFNPTVDLVTSRFIFAASLWLTAVLGIGDRGLGAGERGAGSRGRGMGMLFVLAALAPVYLLTMSHAVGAADTFEFQVVTPQLGIVHPTGYPLYLLLGKLFTLLPFGTLAWRLNFASVVYALAAICLLYLLLLKVLQRPLPAILGAVITGLTLTFWSQAIIAEVYALHALIVMVALYLMAEIGGWGLGAGDRGSGIGEQGMGSGGNEVQGRESARLLLRKERQILLLAFVIGLGMTNHVTTIFLIPPAMLTIIFTHHASRTTHHASRTTHHASRITHHASRTTHHASRITHLTPRIFTLRFLFKLAAAFLLPLLLYAYLPLRWQAVNDEAMGLARFVDWVVAGRFQGALQLRAWLDDPTRYEIMARLFLDNWGWFNLGLAMLGFVILIIKNWRVALVLFSLWFGCTFYTLNYYVPDLAVFVIPAQMVVGVCWAVAVKEIGDWLPSEARLEIGGGQKTQSPISNLQSLIYIILIIPTLFLAINNWSTNDQSGDDGLESWGRMVLQRPLTPNSAILADSEKIAPLHYLQIAEGLRPDLDISVWPDEAAYRAQVDGRIANGQSVYLARQIPNLQGSYHLRSVGPLTEVAAQPLLEIGDLPPSVTRLETRAEPGRSIDFGMISLLGYEVTTQGLVTEIAFYWQATAPVTEVLHVYTQFEGEKPNNGRHPANNFYPTNAWKGDEIVADYHELPHPILTEAITLPLQVALAPPFDDPTTLDWQTVTEVDLPATPLIDEGRPYRIQIGQTTIQNGSFPTQTRPETPLPVTLSGFGDPDSLSPSLTQSPISNLTANGSQSPISNLPFTAVYNINTALQNGRYPLTLQGPAPAICGWMQPASENCVLGEVEISGVPLPETATNFEDKIALLGVDIPNTALQPGGQLQLTLNWLALADMTEDYTITVQVLDANDRLVGQTDSWPVQGTRPTSHWQPGETISDPFVVQLDSELPAGEYRLLVGIYLLGNGRRLSILNPDGIPIDDKFVLPFEEL